MTGSAFLESAPTHRASTYHSSTDTLGPCERGAGGRRLPARDDHLRKHREAVGRAHTAHRQGPHASRPGERRPGGNPRQGGLALQEHEVFFFKQKTAYEITR